MKILDMEEYRKNNIDKEIEFYPEVMGFGDYITIVDEDNNLVADINMSAGLVIISDRYRMIEQGETVNINEE